MEQLLEDTLEPRDVIRSVSFSQQYGFLIEDLRRWGFREADSPPTLRVFPYDWRKSNVLAADRLADLIDQIFNEHSGAAEVSLIAHSMGGLVSRFYLESGRYNGRKGFPAVRRLFTLGTPHRGAPLALTAAIGSERRLFLNAAQVKSLANDPRYPSLYELLPPQGEPFAWDEGPKAAYLPLDPYDPTVAADLGLSAANLGAAKAFHNGLDRNRCPTHVRYFFFVGSRQFTPTSAKLLKSGSGYQVSLLSLDDAGDGTVPIWSASLTGVQGRPVGGEHGEIYKSTDLRSTLAALLGAPGNLGAIIPKVEVFVRDKVVEPKVTLHTAFNFPDRVSNIRGVVSFEKVEVNEAGKEQSAKRRGPRHTLNYSGVAADSIRIALTAPAEPGSYRVVFRDSESRALGKDDFFVQSDEPSKLRVTRRRKPR
jgi:pimeloyl-ACP methyl ester carboxylesterase